MHSKIASAFVTRYAETVTQIWGDHFFWTNDNVRIHYRDHYGGVDGQATILCLPGLTRNSRDFDAFAAHFAPRFRVITTSLRGRGDSGFARDPLTYVPLTYVRDVSLLLKDAGLDKVIIVGTSLGGLLGLLLDATQRDRIAGLVLNDVGPDMEPEGLERIRTQMSRNTNWPTWLTCARDLAKRNGAIHPEWGLPEWLAYAKRVCRISREGRIVPDYDPEIAVALNLPNKSTNAATMDLWLALEGFKQRPVLSLRGELSDVFSAKSQREMAQRLPNMQMAVIPRVGHAPTLAEPQSIQALEAFLSDFIPDSSK